jgi:PleD family two-component response regulator
VTASVGVAVSYDAREIVPADLLGAADGALYAAKARGRDCIVAQQTRATGSVAAAPRSLATGLAG